MKYFIFVLLLVANVNFASELKRGDFNTVVETAIKNNKYVVVEFFSKGCGWCKTMEKKTYEDKKVKELLKKDFLLARIDVEDDSYTFKYSDKTYALDEFLMAVQIRGIPSTAFMDAKGQFVTIIPGYIPAETFYNILLYIKTNCYEKSISFQDFTKRKGKCEESSK